MLKRFLPNDFKQSIFEITPEYLKEHNIKGIITDLDNTLVEWYREEATPEIVEWFKQMQKNGIAVMIVSNNRKKRVANFAKPHGIPYLYDAQKPRGKSFKKALEMMNLDIENTAVIGDQLLTDIFGGNRQGFHTILVTPVTSSDAIWTKLNRKIERLILRWFKKKGLLKWEDMNE